MTVGWFPRWNDDGSELTYEKVGQWQNQWLDRTTEIHHDGERLVIGDVRTEHPALNELTAGGGHWAGWNPGAVYLSWGDPIPGAGCATLNPDGRFAYVDDRQADIKNLMLDGQVVARGAIASVRMSRSLLVWSDSGVTHGLRLDNGEIARIQAAPAEFFPVPVDTPFGPWVLAQTHTGIVLYPFGEKAGYRLDNGGQAFGPDAVYRAAQIHAVFTNDAGVQTIRPFDLSAPRVDLSHTADSPPQPPTPTQEPEPMPMPDPPNRREVVETEWALDPADGTPQDNLAFCRFVAMKLHEEDPRWGLNWKRGKVGEPSRDVLAWRVGPADTDARIVDILSHSDDPANIKPAWTVQSVEKAGPVRWYWEDDSAPVPPSGIPNPDTQSGIEAAILRLIQEVTEPLKAEIADLTARVRHLEAHPASEPISIDGARIALKTDSGRYLCAENGGGGEVNATREAARAWETFTVEVQ